MSLLESSASASSVKPTIRSSTTVVFRPMDLFLSALRVARVEFRGNSIWPAHQLSSDPLDRRPEDVFFRRRQIILFGFRIDDRKHDSRNLREVRITNPQAAALSCMPSGKGKPHLPKAARSFNHR